MSKEQTAMRQLINKINNDKDYSLPMKKHLTDIATGLLEIEKQQIIDAREDGFMSEVLNGRPIISNETYFNNKFNNEKQ